MNSMFDEKLKTKLAQEDEANQERRKKAESLDTYDNVATGKQALSDNAVLLDSEKHPVLRNFNGALISMFAIMRKIERRLDYLENKIDVIYQNTKEDRY